MEHMIDGTQEATVVRSSISHLLYVCIALTASDWPPRFNRIEQLHLRTLRCSDALLLKDGKLLPRQGDPA